jgi:hypothetical protein
MTSTLLQVNIVPKRMLTKSEAAAHCGRSVKRFEIEFEKVAPVRFQNGDLRWDINDLDAALNNLKGDSGEQSADAIVARLT